MKSKIILLGCLILVLTFGAQAQEKPSDAPKPELTPYNKTPSEEVPKLQAEIDALIIQLGDEKAELRDKAQAELIKIGTPALPALKKALNNKNPEIASRAKILLQPFTLWVLFDNAIQKGAKVLGESKIPESEGIVFLKAITDKDGIDTGYIMEVFRTKTELVSRFYFNSQFIFTNFEEYNIKDKKSDAEVTGRVIYDAKAKEEYNKKILAKSGDKLETIEPWFGKVEGKLTYENRKTGGKGEYPFSKKLMPTGAMFLVPQLMVFSDDVKTYEFSIFTLPSMIGGDIFWKVVCEKLGKEEIDVSGTKYKAYKFSIKMSIPFAHETEKNPKVYLEWVSEDGKLLKLGE